MWKCVTVDHGYLNLKKCKCRSLVIKIKKIADIQEKF